MLGDRGYVPRGGAADGCCAEKSIARRPDAQGSLKNGLGPFRCALQRLKIMGAGEMTRRFPSRARAPDPGTVPSAPASELLSQTLMYAKCGMSLMRFKKPSVH
jgi:hypothetical protein